MKKLVLVLILIGSLSFTACKKDAQINDFLKEYASVIDAVSEKLDDGDADAAQKIFDDRKDNLRWKWEKIKYTRSWQVNKDTLNKMNSYPQEHIDALVKTSNEAIKKKPEDEEKIKNLVNAIANTVRR
ncbi:MAG TPA: hypothetical protein PKY59_17805 [Pyrinomonadaceae bacterium]|nr:hypothetical protein [Pyrinomonadaceae bacterium]